MKILTQKWFLYAAITTIFWGVWGAFIEIPEKAGFPATLGYVVWSITLIPCSIISLALINWKLEYNIRSIVIGSLIGILGAGGQLLLFEALREGPAYLVFPFISLFPIFTILLSFIFLKEKASKRQWLGIVIALLAIFLLSWQPNQKSSFEGTTWIFLSLIVFAMWGAQAFVMKFANDTMKAESIFFYMTITALLLVPIALLMTDFTSPINWGVKGPYLAFIVHVLNAVGALTLVYALRYGKAIVVVPMTGLSPIITVVISLIIYAVIPGPSILIGVAAALVSIYFLSE